MRIKDEFTDWMHEYPEIQRIEGLLLKQILINYKKEGVSYKNILKNKGFPHIESEYNIKKILLDKAIDNLKRQEIIFEPTKDFLRLQPWVLEKLK